MKRGLSLKTAAPQILQEAGFANKGQICVTQPRRVVSGCLAHLLCPTGLQHLCLLRSQCLQPPGPAECRITDMSDWSASEGDAAMTSGASPDQSALPMQAAVTVARRVAQEMGTEMGHRVGYAVRFEERSSPATCIKYLTGEHVLNIYWFRDMGTEGAHRVGYAVRSEERSSMATCIKYLAGIHTCVGSPAKSATDIARSACMPQEQVAWYQGSP